MPRHPDRRRRPPPPVTGPAGARPLPRVLARRGGPEPVFTLALDPDLAGFQGHFPGRPILPGVVQVHWAAGFGAEAFGPLGAFRGLAQVKFHRIVGPGRSLDLHLAHDPARGRLDFRCQDGPELLSSGILRFQPGPDPGPDPAGTDTDSAATAGGTPPPLPHQPPMRLLEALLEADERGCATRARVDPAAWYAAPDGSAPGWIGLEWMAQTIAAHNGWCRQGAGGAPKLGYLLGSRAYTCDRPAFPAGAEARIEAVVQDRDPGGLGIYACTIRCQGRPAAQAVVTVFEP